MVEPVRGVAEGRPQRVVVFIPYYLPGFRGGGPIRTVAAMVSRHGERTRFRIITADRDWGEAAPLPVTPEVWTRVGRAGVWYARSGGVGSWVKAYAQARTLRPDVLYLNGVFPPLTTIAPLVLSRVGVLSGQVVIAPRGEFGSGALELRARKKSVFLATARRAGLFRGVLWHASTPVEAAEIRAVVPGASVLVRENESDLPVRADRSACASAVAAASRVAGDASRTGAASAGGVAALRVVYVGRLADKKGVDVLLAALAFVEHPVVLEVVGSSADDAYVARCQTLAAEARRRGHVVTFVGGVPAEEVRGVFARSDVFAFPTAHENFGHTIAEALSVGCPVVLPDTTPWTATLRGGGGEVIDGHDPQVWARAITGWAALSSEELRGRRERAAEAYDAWASSWPSESVFDVVAELRSAPRTIPR